MCCYLITGVRGLVVSPGSASLQSGGDHGGSRGKPEETPRQRWRGAGAEQEAGPPRLPEKPHRPGSPARRSGSAELRPPLGAHITAWWLEV